VSKTEHRPWGSGILKVKEISALIKIFQISADEMKVKPVQIAAAQGPRMGSGFPQSYI
jgi:hypothetical protein